MKKISKILTEHKYAIIWTVCYMAITWAVLYFMFKFNIFNGAQWHKLAHAQLHGFAGFVFGILILSTLPLYIATTTLIIRTKKPLVTIPVPKIPLPKWPIKTTSPAPTQCDTPDKDKITEEKTTPDQESQAETTSELPPELPPELHGAFIRARNHISLIQINTPQDTSGTTDNIPDTNDTLPLPSDFDIEIDSIPGMEDTTSFNVPVFTDINFDQENTDTTPTKTHSDYDNTDLIKYLKEKNIEHNIHDEIVTTSTHAIITHSDNNFWVIDNENWFANGQTRPALQKTITEFATKHNLTPVIYLAAQNIMDIDIHSAKWKSNGIIIITSPDEL